MRKIFNIVILIFIISDLFLLSVAGFILVQNSRHLSASSKISQQNFFQLNMEISRQFSNLERQVARDKIDFIPHSAFENLRNPFYLPPIEGPVKFIRKHRE